jgi:hypothetical protein
MGYRLECRGTKEVANPVVFECHCIPAGIAKMVVKAYIMYDVLSYPEGI